jgi:hypothetical protein
MTPRKPSAASGGLLVRLRERGVVRVAARYAVIGWLTLQIASVVFEPLGVPKGVMTALIIAEAAGFPLVIALAWFLEISEHGVQLDTAAAGVPRPTARALRRYADAIVICVFLIAVVILAVRQSDLGKLKPPANPAIAVLPFDNLGGDPQQRLYRRRQLRPRNDLVHIRQELRPTRRLPVLLKFRQCLLLHCRVRSVINLA